MPYHNAVALKVDTARADAIADALATLSVIQSIERLPSANGHVQLRALPKGGAMIAAEVATLLSERSLPVAELYVERGRLDEVFRKITSEEASRHHA
jgi:ABC-2 type transport system ATP-binding protein